VAKWIPDNASSLVIVDADRLFNGPLGKKDDWGTPKAADFAGRPVLLNPNTLRLVRAGEFSFDTLNAPSQVAQLSLRKSPKLETIADKEKGYVESIGNTRVAWSPRGAYAVNLDAGLVGLCFPANRQYFSRWTKQRRGQASSYLVKVLTDFDSSKQAAAIVFDLDDALAASQIETELVDLKCLADKKQDLKAIARALEGVRGVKLGITITDKATGRLVIEFSDPPSVLQSVAKPLVIEAISALGYELDDIEQWKQTMSGLSITLEGDLSRSGLMRLSSTATRARRERTRRRPIRSRRSKALRHAKPLQVGPVAARRFVRKEKGDVWTGGEVGGTVRPADRPAADRQCR